MRRLAVLSLHTSPLAQPGTGDGGGMNVYVRELSSALARAGVICDVYTRAWSDDLPRPVDIEPGFRVHHVPAGPPAPMAKEALPGVVDEFADGVLKSMTSAGRSAPTTTCPSTPSTPTTGSAGSPATPSSTSSTCRWSRPSTPSTGSRPRPAPRRSRPTPPTSGPRPRRRSSAARTPCSPPARSRPTQISDLYGADPSRIRIVAPGVDHAFFGPGDRAQARRALELPADGPAPALRRADPAAEGRGGGRAPPWPRSCGTSPDARLVIVGGPSGPHGEDEVDRIAGLVESLDLGRPGASSCRPSPTSCCRPTTGPPTCAWSPAGPSPSAWWPWRRRPAARRWWRPTSAGCAAWSTTAGPATWSRTPHPEAYAAWVRQILAEPLLAERLSTGSVLRARRYTWARAAHLLVDIYADLTAGRLVDCT